MLDYIIVGSGLAGSVFSETALSNNKKILVFDEDIQNSSKVAAGLFNPVVLKRFSVTTDAKLQLLYLNHFYPLLETKLKTKFFHKIPILRKFTSIEEQNDWLIASDNLLLEPFLSNPICQKKINHVNSPFHYGKVNETGFLDTLLFLNTYKEYLTLIESYKNETFDYSKIEIYNDFVLYKNIKAKHIIFAEGFRVLSNPYFNFLPVDGTKGELLLIKAPNLTLDVIVNASLFILPIGSGLFKVGATYNWSDKTTKRTSEGKKELIDKLKQIIQCDFEIIDHYAGIRPTVKDRKPLIGTHYKHKNLHVLNGLGTRGVMLAPYLSNLLFEKIENNIEINYDYSIERVYKKLKLI